MERFQLVDFQKESLPEDSEGYKKIGFNDPIKHPGINLHPCNFGIYDPEVGLVAYIPDYIKNNKEYCEAVIYALEHTIKSEV